MQVGLFRHGEDHDIAFAVQLPREPLAAGDTRLIIVRANEKQPLTAGRVGVHGDDRYTGGNRFIDIALHQLWIGTRHQNPRRFLGDDLFKSLLLRLRIETVRAHELRAHL